MSNKRSMGLAIGCFAVGLGGCWLLRDLPVLPRCLSALVGMIGLLALSTVLQDRARWRKIDALSLGALREWAAQIEPRHAERDLYLGYLAYVLCAVLVAAAMYARSIAPLGLAFVCWALGNRRFVHGLRHRRVERRLASLGVPPT